MPELDLVRADPFARLKDGIGEVCFPKAKEFRRESDAEIVSQLHGLAATKEAREAAAELACDCGTLAEDIALAGANPTQAWDEVIENDRLRARLSLERLTTSLSACVPLDSKTGAPLSPPSSVLMKRKTFRRSNS